MTAQLPDSGAAKELEAEDPLELQGVVFRGDAETSRDMARCFIEEYALLGFPRDHVRRLFVSPAFYGTRALAQQHGLPFIEQLLDQVFGKEGASDATGS